MKNLDKIADELFNKIRGRFPKVTLGDKESTITNMPETARFFDFEFKPGATVNVTIDEESLTVLYNNKLIEGEPQPVKAKWYEFMKELRTFAKKRMLNFDTRDITKSNLDKRDYQYLSQNRPGEEQMSESKLYGTSKTSFQNVGNARLVVKHSGPVDHENPAGRTQQIHSLYVESAEGERFRYPFRHLNGARAMAQHVSEGGNQYDAFGKYIVSLSEELSKLRQFKTYMNRSSVMAEGLAGYMDIVNERIDTVKETVMKLQRNSYYKEAVETFEEKVLEEVPEDVSSTWIDELTIRQFNEELKSVFPYIYNLVKEGMKPTELTPDSLKEFDGPDETQTDDKKDQLEAWYNKYKKYEGSNGDELPGGMFRGHIDTGILTDGVEANELGDAIEKLGGDRSEAEHKLFHDDSLFSKLLPITDAMQKEYLKIMGVSEIDEDNCTEAVKILGSEITGFDVESMDMNQNYANHLDSVIDNSVHEVGPQGQEPHAHKLYVDGDYDQDRGISDKDCDEMKMALEKAGIKADCEPDEMRQGGVIIHTMSDKDSVIKALSGADYSIEEGNEFAQKVRELKAKGAKPGTKFKTSDGEEHTLESAIEAAGLDILEFWTEDELAESGIMYKAGVKKYGKEGMSKIQSAAGKGASAEEIGAIKDKYNKKNEGGNAFDLAITYAEEVISDSMSAEEAIEKIKELQSDEDDRYAQKVYQDYIDDIERDGFAKVQAKIAQADMAGPESADDDTMDVDIGPDGSISKAGGEKEKNELPLDEFIKGHFDYTTNQFPKGETAVLTAVEKKFGEGQLKDAALIMAELVKGEDEEMQRIKTLAGLEH